VTFTVSQTGSLPIYYQWRFNGTNLTGQTASSLSLTNIQLVSAGAYSVLVTNAGDAITSQVAILTVLGGFTPPTITSQPQSTNVLLGGIAQFSLVATGTPPLFYQWLFNGTNLVGATNSILGLTNVQDSQAGAYSVVVSNGSVEVSSNALLTINHSPIAGTDSLIQTLTNGAKVYISDLLTNDYDPDGDMISFISASGGSTNGGVVTTNQGWVYYAPPSWVATNQDAFSYSISDGRGGIGVGWVIVGPPTDLAPSPNLILTRLSDTDVLLQFNGIPGFTYRIQSATNLVGPVWQTVGSVVADPFGVFLFTNDFGGGETNMFFRSAFP
jgi:hypothetical protein